VAPHRDSDVDLLGDRLVIPIEGFVAGSKEVQHRRVHHNVGCARRLCMPRQFDHGVHVLVGTGSDDSGRFADFVKGYFDNAFALGKRHRKEFTLFAADENTVDAEVVDPVAQISAKSLFVDRKVIGKRDQRRRPNALHVGPRVGFGVLAGISFHFFVSTYRRPARAKFLR
jgi:hypothetical protein